MLGPIKRRSLDHPVTVSLEALVSKDDFYRNLDRLLDLSFVRELVSDTYAGNGRPSIDPVVFFKLHLIMFFEGIRSERQLMRVVPDRLSLRWYLGYDFGEALPDHSSLTRLRDRYGVEVFRRFFEAIVEQCQQAGLVWGKELYFDATQVDANAALSSTRPRFAVEAHLKQVFACSDDDRPPPPEDGPPPSGLLRLPELSAKNAGNEPTEGEARPRGWLSRLGQPDRTIRHGDYRRQTNYRASPTDPDAALMRRKHGGAHFGYHDHYVVDGGKSRIILRVLVTPADVMENQPMLDLLWSARFRWRLHPQQVTGDTTYGTAENIVAIEDAAIRAYVPLTDFDKRTPFFGQKDFTYDAEQDCLVCPQGAVLSFRHHKRAASARAYRAPAATCNTCPLKPQCTESKQGRSLRRSVYSPYLDRVRAYHLTEPYRQAIRKRELWMEPLFGEAKDWHGLRRFRLRGLPKVNIEALIVATGQNLKRLLSALGWGRRPWPDGALGLAPLGPLSAFLASY
jgi:transposase